MQNLTDKEIKDRTEKLNAIMERGPALASIVNHLNSGNVTMLNGNSQVGVIEAIAIRIAHQNSPGITKDVFWVTSGGAQLERNLPVREKTIPGGLFFENTCDIIPRWAGGNITGNPGSAGLLNNNIQAVPLKNENCASNQHTYTKCNSADVNKIIKGLYGK